MRPRSSLRLPDNLNSLRYHRGACHIAPRLGGAAPNNVLALRKFRRNRNFMRRGERKPEPHAWQAAHGRPWRVALLEQMCFHGPSLKPETLMATKARSR